MHSHIISVAFNQFTNPSIVIVSSSSELTVTDMKERGNATINVILTKLERECLRSGSPEPIRLIYPVRAVVAHFVIAGYNAPVKGAGERCHRQRCTREYGCGGEAVRGSQ